MDVDFERLNKRAADQLRATALVVEQAETPSCMNWEIPFSDLAGSRLDLLIDSIRATLGETCRSLYTFDCRTIVIPRM